MLYIWFNVYEGTNLIQEIIKYPVLKDAYQVSEMMETLINLSDVSITDSGQQMVDLLFIQLSWEKKTHLNWIILLSLKISSY